MNGRINRTNDYAFKRIMGSGQEALISFLNAVLKPEPGKELASVQLLDRELDPRYLAGQSSPAGHTGPNSKGNPNKYRGAGNQPAQH